MIFTACDPPCAIPETCTPVVKRPGEARFVFISRICRIKNPAFVIDMLHGVRGVTLDMYGPAEEAFDLKGHYRGILRPEEVLPTLQRGHFFVLPTLGENFCHAIFEALTAGCPPIISTNTPWHDLMKYEAGWTLPLNMPKSWRWVIDRCIQMDNETYAGISKNAHAYARNWYAGQRFNEQHAEMFTQAISLKPQV